MFIPLSDTNKLKHIKLQYVTLGILAVNILIWVLTGTPALMSQEGIRAAVESYGYIPAVANGYQAADFEALPTTATYFSYSFLHGDFMHLAGNMLFIWVFGDNVEDAMGHWKYFIFYFICAAAGAYAHGLVAPQSSAPLIGASGAVAGIIGAYILLHPKVKVWILAMGRIPLKIPAGFVLGFWIVFQFYQFFANPESSVSFAAHIGGAVAGMALIFVMRRPGVVLFDADLVVDNPPIEQSPTQTPEFEKPVVTSKKPIEKESGASRKSSVPSFGKKSDKNKWGR